MATRSIGTVTGATVLMLIFQSLQTRGPQGLTPDGFIPAFQATFRIAAMIPAALILLEFRRPRRQTAPNADRL
jgi:hypothetical protein